MRTHPTILATVLTLSCATLLASTEIAGASNTGPGDDPAWSLGAEMSAAAGGTTTQQTSASAWAESRGDFNSRLRSKEAEAMKARWQRHYMTGKTVSGEAAESHVTKRRLKAPKPPLPGLGG